MKSLPAAAICLALLPAWASARPEPTKDRVVRHFEQKITLGPKGDGTAILTWTLPPAEFKALKDQLGSLKQVDRDGKASEERQRPSAANLSQFLNLRSLWLRPERVRIGYEEPKHLIRATVDMAGWATTTGPSGWRAEILDNARWYNLLDDSTLPRTGTVDFEPAKGGPGNVHRFVARSVSPDGRFENVQALEVHLPAAASRVELRKRPTGRWAISYTLRPPTAQRGTAAAEPVLRLVPRHEIAPVIHKLYGDPAWATLALAQLIFENPGRDRIAGLRVRARLATSLGRSGWGEWEEVAALVHPGTQVQHALYLVLDTSALMLRSRENGKLFLEVEYTPRSGRKVTRLLQGTLNVLGRNDIPYTLLDLRRVADASFHHKNQDTALLLAAMVTPNDPVVKELKGRLASFIGGAPVGLDDNAAIAYTKAIYDFFRANIAYSTPTGSVGEDSKPVQHVNYARDVLKTGSGTCIDLAVTFAALAEAGGLPAGVVLIPRHAFAFVVLPKSGRVLWIETTCCGRGTLDGSLPFEVALQRGAAHLRDAKGNPRTDALRVDLWRLRGLVSEPELPGAVTQNMLTGWGRRLPPSYPAVTFDTPAPAEHNVMHNGKLGVRLTVQAEVAHSRGQVVEIALALITPEGKLVPSIIRLTPDADRLEPRNYSFFFAYDDLGSAADGKWRQFELRGGAFSHLYRERAVVRFADERVLLRRLPTSGNSSATVQSLRVQSQLIAGPRPGLALLVTDVQGGSAGRQLIATVVEAATRQPVKKADGTTVSARANLTGRAVVFLPAADLPAARPGQPRVLHLELCVLDAPAGRRLLDVPPVLALRL